MSPTELSHSPHGIKFHLATALCVMYCYSHFRDEEIQALCCSGTQGPRVRLDTDILSF